MLSVRAQAAGVFDVLRKPLVRRDIAEPVARALQRATRQSGKDSIVADRQMPDHGPESAQLPHKI
jgi:FixJ family two-component response regulator